ncbi:hypothetical protein EJ03DRAFT_215640 [Teratosphaeria nubilosa]|uniref:Uncharacterized protein n=1 Tax=Teratosphaeria nubilosa TaxID=161662 RepID=A0A6G1LI09_9PEZI|nr:hypothetical protein EJ03DRAFT_215640 [Teratosphaeria nubilosa]
MHLHRREGAGVGEVAREEAPPVMDEGSRNAISDAWREEEDQKQLDPWIPATGDTTDPWSANYAEDDPWASSQPNDININNNNNTDYAPEASTLPVRTVGGPPKTLGTSSDASGKAEVPPPPPPRRPEPWSAMSDAIRKKWEREMRRWREVRDSC